MTITYKDKAVPAKPRSKNYPAGTTFVTGGTTTPIIGGTAANTYLIRNNDITTPSEYNTFSALRAIAQFLDKESFANYLELTTDEAGNKFVHVKGNLYTDGGLSAFGDNTLSGGGTASGIDYEALQTLLTGNTNAYDINLAFLSAINQSYITSKIADLYADKNHAHANYVLSTDSRLTNARYNPYALTFTGYVSAVYDGSNAITIDFPTKLSQFTNDIITNVELTKAQVEAVLTGNITSHTHSYLTGNQSISITGDATGTGTTAIALTLANSGVTAGTYRSVTVDAKGRVTSGTNPTTLSGYGIADALPLAGGTISGNLTITGNLILNGTTTTINSTTMSVDDPILTLGGDTAPTVNDGKDRGIEFRYYDTSAKLGFFGYDASTGYFSCYTGAANSNEVFSGTLADIAATNFRGVLIGNASTASKLANSRTLWGQSFDGTANITGPLSNVTDLMMSGILNIGSAQLIYDPTTNSIRVQKSDGTAINFYSTGEVASYGVGSYGDTSYINGFLNISTTNDDSAGINLLKITSNSTDVLKYTRKYNGYDTYDLIMGSWSSIQATNRLDFYANQIFFNTNNTYYQCALCVNRTGDASSTATQKNSYPIVFQNSLWNGRANTRAYNSIKSIASTTVNQDNRLAVILNTNEVGDGGTEIMSIKSNNVSVNTNITATGSGTFNGGSFSSLRSLKNVHNDWTGNALDEIFKVKVRSFNYKSEPIINKTLGFIIDEIPDSISEYMLFGKEKDSINLYTLHALSFLAHQQTKTRLEELEEEVIDLKQKINKLENLN